MRRSSRFSNPPVERSSVTMTCPACPPDAPRISVPDWFVHVHNAHPAVYRDLYGSTTPPLPQDPVSDHLRFASETLARLREGDQ